MPSSALSTSLAFPLGEYVDSVYATVYDHVTRGLERLLYQFQGEAHPLIQALVDAPLQVSTVLDQLTADVAELRWLDTATGEQLDVLGSILGLEREGRVDADYLLAIRATIRVLRSNGSIDEIFAPFDYLAEGNNARVDDLPLDHAGFRISMTIPVLSDATAEQYRRVIMRSRVGGVRVWFYSWPAAGTTLFSFSSVENVIQTDAALGFDGSGGMAREEIA